MSEPKDFKVEASGTTVLLVEMNGKTYEIKLAPLVMSVVDVGHTNPIDGTPVFQVISQLVTQVAERKQ